MHWQLNSYTVSLIISATVSGAVAIYAWRSRPARGATLLALFMIAATEWALSYALELGSLGLAPKVFWSKVQYLGITATAPLLLLFVLQYTANNRWLTGWAWAFLAILPAATLILAWSNELHGLIWAEVSLQTDGRFPMLVLEHGPFFYIFVVYSYTCVLLSTVLLTRAWLRPSRLDRGQVSILLAGMLAPWAANLAYILNWIPFPNLDLTPFAFTISGTIATWGLLRFQLFDIVPTARHSVLENMADGVIVLNKRGQVADINPTAQQLIGRPATQAIGRPAEEALTGWPDLLDHLLGAEAEMTRTELPRREQREFYDLQIAPLRDRRGKLNGRVLLLHNTTSLKQAESTLTRLLELSQVLVTTRDVDMALQRAAISAVEIVRAADRCTLQWLDQDGKRLQTVAVSEQGTVSEDLPNFELGKGVAGHALLNRETINVPNVLQDERFVPGDELRFHSLLVAPLLVKDRALGTLSLSSQNVGAFSSQDETLIRLMADQVAAVLDNAHEFSARRQAEQSLHRYTERLHTLHQIDQSIQAARHPESIAIAAIGRIRHLVPCQRAMILAIEPTGQVRLLAAQTSEQLDLVDDVERYRPMLEGEAARQLRIQGSQDLTIRRRRTALEEAMVAEGILSYAVVPLYIRDELVGTLHLEATQPGAFTADHMEIAGEVAASLAVAIRQIWLYEQAQRELTERMQAEAKLRQYAAELEAHNAELDAFAHTVAHDLKNPVSVILGYTQLLEQKRSRLSEEQVQEMLSMLVQTGHKMQTIIEELLLLSAVRGMAELDTHPLDMGHIISEVQRRLRHMVEDHQAELIAAESWPVSLGHGPWVEEVWVNYVSNAIKYGGRPPRVELGYDRSNGDGAGQGMIRFWVRDNGPGLGPDEQASLFTPFERLHQVGIEGHGLGLSIVERIVHKLGGHVGVESAGVSGQGSTFYFTLPAGDVEEA